MRILLAIVAVIGAILVLLVTLLPIFFKEISPVQIEVPELLTVEKVLDPYGNEPNDALYYITTDRPVWNLNIEEELDTKYIFKSYSTGLKNISTIHKDELLELLDDKVEALYYDENEWWGIDSSDTYAAILTDHTGQRYLAPVQLYPCGTELVIGDYDYARKCGE